MLCLVWEVIRRLGDEGTVRKWGEMTGGGYPIFSYDNPSIHSHPILKQFFQTTIFTRFSLPPKSPDFHRCIERVHGRICNAFRKWLVRQPRQCNMFECISKLKDIFFETETADATFNDICSYHLMLDSILVKEGSWAERRFR